MISFSQLPRITEGRILNLAHDRNIENIVTDSRKVAGGEGVVFFAIKGTNHDGHQYIQKVYDAGVRQFVTETHLPALDAMKDCNIFLCDSTLNALQELVAHHRSLQKAQVVAITGSNGKTIVKEWLFQLLSDRFSVVKNPGSYNSQLGVPLSVWQLRPDHQIGIFEAGISTRNEMPKLERILRPDIGIFTNIGSAHDEGFSSLREKAEEKAKLFVGASVVIYCRDHSLIHEVLTENHVKMLSWGVHRDADIKISINDDTALVKDANVNLSLKLPFTDRASIENCLHCIAVLIHLGIPSQVIEEKIKLLKSVPMRLELKDAINQCQLIDDTYNNDLAGLQISLQFISNQHQKKKKTLILSDVLESGLQDAALIDNILTLVRQNNIHRFIGIGPK